MKGKKKKASIILPAVFIFFIICLTVLGLFLHITRPDSEAVNPLFEEIYTSTNQLDSLISRIDNFIYEVLYQEGIKEINVIFSEVIPQHKDDAEWDFTVLSVKLSDSASVNKLQMLIKNKCEEVSPDISVETKLVEGNQSICNIYALGYYTHKIILDHKEQKEKKSVSLPKIAIIIDDIGYDYPLAVEFMDLELPISLSVLPGAPHARQIARKAEKKGCELLLHLPMEPRGYPGIDPGPGTLLTSMDRETIQRIVRENIQKVPGIKGVNHHMGSLFSEKFDKMKHVLDEIKRNGLFYVDSRTTNRTVAYKLAIAIGLPAAKKSLFIDNDLSKKALRYQMERLLGIARYSGSAVGIGHPHKETYDILLEYGKKLKSDFIVVPVSKLVN